MMCQGMPKEKAEVLFDLIFGVQAQSRRKTILAADSILHDKDNMAKYEANQLKENLNESFGEMTKKKETEIKNETMIGQL